MKKPSSKIREEIAKLQEQLKHAETREAERIGRIALKAGLGDIDIEEADLQAAFEDVAKPFRAGQRESKPGSNGKERAGASGASSSENAPIASGAAQGGGAEA